MRRKVSYQDWKNISTDESDYLIYDILYEILEKMERSIIKPEPRPQPRPIHNPNSREEG